MATNNLNITSAAAPVGRCELRYSFLDPAVQRDTPIQPADILRTAAMQKAVAHLAVETGGRQARRTAHKAARTLSRIAAQLPAGHLSIRHIDWTDWHQLSIGLWYCDHDVVQWAATIYVSGSRWLKGLEWRYETDSSMEADLHSAFRADVFVRRIVARRDIVRSARRAQAELQAAKYADQLPDPARTLQQTCRATCLRVSQDGQSVTEALHDVGGSMTMRAGSNGWTMPASLAPMQSDHDAIYHRER